MCHDFLNDSRFYRYLFLIDQDIAADVQSDGCQYCGGVLHSACYPRKPHGIRSVLDASYRTRLSFCCATAGCRRRTTPPSVRFLGRKVYPGIFIILVTALEQGLTPRRRKQLIEQLDLYPQTLSRWRKWWRVTFPASRCWQAERGNYAPPVEINHMPGALLGRLIGHDLKHRLFLLLRLIAASPPAPRNDICFKKMYSMHGLFENLRSNTTCFLLNAGRYCLSETERATT